jgi:hypothetical protein
MMPRPYYATRLNKSSSTVSHSTSVYNFIVLYMHDTYLAVDT